MIPERHARYYAYVWPLFWPWLWLLLRRLEKWQHEVGCDVTIAVDRMGNIYVRHINYDSDLEKWRYDAPAVPVWARPALGSDMPVEFLEVFASASAREGAGLSAACDASAPVYLNFDTS